MEKIFVDTDIIIDLLTHRKYHYHYAALLFSKTELSKIQFCKSPISFSVIHYIISTKYSSIQSRRTLLKLKTLACITTINSRVVESALNSDCKDFEDGLQYFTALENITFFSLTRNLKDYQIAKITVMTAEQHYKTKK